MNAYGLYGGTLLFFIGFIFTIGRRRGRAEGMTEGLHIAPLELRRIGLERGRCVLCGEGDTGEDVGEIEQKPGTSDADEQRFES